VHACPPGAVGRGEGDRLARHAAGTQLAQRHAAQHVGGALERVADVEPADERLAEPAQPAPALERHRHGQALDRQDAAGERVLGDVQRRRRAVGEPDALAPEVHGVGGCVRLAAR
jgi:hypothetical protein